MGGARVAVSAGVRAGERTLVRALLRAATEPERPLDRPLRVVVPSRSLRQHLASRLMAEHGRPLLALQLHTLDGVARTVVEAAGLAGPSEALFPVEVRRLARREPALADGLDGLRDGYGPVVGVVDDLLDAGLLDVHAEVLAEQLAEQPGPPGAIRRAQALVRVAARMAERLDAGEAGHRSRTLATARACLERDPGLLPTAGLWLHGFADATGVQADLIAELLRLPDAHLRLERPAPGQRFGAAFRERLAVTDAAATDRAEPTATRVRLLRAPMRTAEVRAVAAALRARLDAGAEPERLAVVARDLAPYRVALRAQLDRFAVPFSGLAEPGAATPVRRRLDALLAFVEAGPDAAMEPWLAARDDLAETLRHDLRHAFHRRGSLRLDEVAGFASWPEARRLDLDARRGLVPADGERPPHAARRSVDGAALAGAGRAADALLRHLAERPARRPLADHARWLVDLVSRALGWPPDGPERAALDAMLATLPSEPEVDAEEFLGLARKGLADAGRDRLGGEGGGVQVLSVMEARARSFDALFVLGMNRGVFPRTIADDPLLPDAVRARMREVLPGLPVKREGFDEERFLFAGLLSAASEVTLSWSETNDAGRPQPRSPLLDGLEREVTDLVEEAAPPLHAPAASPSALAPSERALLAGLHGDRAAFGHALAAAARDERLADGDAQVESLVQARLAVLDELDPPHARRHLLGPYFGFVGAPGDPADPRPAPLYVTGLERVARCPWQGFLARVLRLSPAPDAAHELPSADDRRLLGNVVHAVLERVVAVAIPDTEPETADLAAREPVPVAWPEDATLERWCHECAAEELRDEANAVPGYARVLARRARPYLERAREADWSEAPPQVVGGELQVTTAVRDRAGAERRLAFKADRVDHDAGGLVFTDYKTGKPIASQRRAAAREAELLRQVASGRALQAALYARSGGEAARGRYLFLSERAPEEARALVARDEAPLSQAFDDALAVLLDVWDQGSFLPRLRQADRDEEPGSCRFCDLKEACLRGDSGARLRLERWSLHDGTRGDAERIAADAFTLGTEVPS